MSKQTTLIERLQEQASKQPHKRAFTFLADGETEIDSLTYHQLDEKAKAIASVLQEDNAQGQRALLLYQPGLEFITAFLGCLYAGVVAVPVYPPRANRSLDRLLAIIADAEASLALTTNLIQEQITSKLPSNHGTEKIKFIATDTFELNIASGWQHPGITKDHLAFLQYTSGSTGTPKGVMVNHGNLLANSDTINYCFQNSREHTAVSWLPPYHDMGLIGCIIQPMYIGLSMYLMAPVTFLQRPYHWLKAISRYQGVTNGGPNFAYDLCVERITPEQKATLDLSCWELAFSGAEPVRAETIERFSQYFRSCGFRRQAFYPCYGMAESTLMITGGDKHKEPITATFDSKELEQNRAVAPGNEDSKVTLVSSGSNIPGQSIVIANPETQTQCSEGEVGEIWAKSDSVAQGYWNRPELTSSCFNAVLADTKEAGWLRTGDLGFLQSGELFVTGRLKDLIIIRGRNYYPQDIELTVDNAHEAIRAGNLAAFALEVAGKEELVITSEIKRTHLRKLNVEEVTKAVRKAISQNHELQTHAIVLLKTGSIPKTSSGKIQRHACKAGYLNGSLNTVGEYKAEVRNQKSEVIAQDKAVFSHPQLNEKQHLIQSWLVENLARRLGISTSEIEINEPFASSGLNSVDAISLSADLEDWLDIKLSPTIVYDYPNIAELAAYLADSQSHTSTPKTQKLKPNAQSDIAIIGIGCRFPGGNNPEQFWQLLRDGKDAITKSDRWQEESWGGFIENVDQFDPQFFGITPREAQSIDPQQRLLLEVSWSALENAAIANDNLAGSNTGVFIGMSSSDYSQLRFHYGVDVDAYAGTGNAHSIAANRLSYLLDLKGPSLAVDTACSSSLVAVHLASQSLKTGECDQAIAGGVNLMLSPELTRTFSLAGMMAEDGRCKTFDAAADGYVRGEGCGVVILKRLEDAQQDGDRILAVIKGSAINQDGKSNGLTAPNGLAQQAVIRQALANANLTAAEISYIESHGTGTSLGDPIEVNSLKAILDQESDQSQSCYLGSLKTNIGHLEAAAGIAGLIKTVLCLEHQAIPPNLHFKQLNPLIDLSDSGISIPNQLQPWQTLDKNKYAGVSSFGFGGTNAHLVVGEATGLPKNKRDLGESGNGKRTKIPERPLHLLTLSAKSEAALADLVLRYKNYLQDNSAVNLADICHTANTGRIHFNHRLAIAVDSPAQLQSHLADLTTGKLNASIVNGETIQDSNNQIAFLFTGQGSQYVNMGYQLYQTQPVFKKAIDQCAEILESYLDEPLLHVLYPDSSSLIPHPSSLLNKTVYTQPAIFALEYALAQMWLDWGVKPAALIGHSVGEYVAATVAGVFSLADGLKLVATRGKLMQNLSHEGEMYAVFANEATITSVIEPFGEQLAIAAINSPQSIVISGAKIAVEEVISKFDLQGIKSKQLTVSHAFHSPLMNPILAEFSQVAESVSYNLPQIKVISNVTGHIATTEISNPTYWVNHVVAPVRFADGIQTLQRENCQIFLEIGSKPILLGMGRSALATDNKQPNQTKIEWLPSLRPRKKDWQQVLQSLGCLYTRGVAIDWHGFDQGYNRQKLALPTYPFQRQSYWLTRNTKSINSKVEVFLPSANKSESKQPDFYQIEWQVEQEKLNTKSVKYKNSKPWLIFADANGLGAQIASTLEQHQQNVILYGDLYSNPKASKANRHVNLDQLTQLFKQHPELAGIIYLTGLDNTPEPTITEINNYQQQHCTNVLNIVQALYQNSVNTPIWFATRGYQEIDNSLDSSAVASSCIWGLANAIAIEHPEYWGGIVDLAKEPDAKEAERLLGIIAAQNQEDRVAIRQDEVYVPRLQKTAPLNPVETLELAAENSYLITGGLGSLGLKIAQWLANKGAKNLLLLGRSKPSEYAQQEINKLEQQGVNVNVIQVDITDYDVLKNIVRSQESGVLKDTASHIRSQESQRRFGLPHVVRSQNLKVQLNSSSVSPSPHLPISPSPIKGIIHAAGVLDDGLLQRQTWSKFERAIAPKVAGAWNLHRATKDISLDFFVLFSSVASLIGSPGQSNYGVANTGLDAIARYRRSLNLPALSINWGAWGESGMAVKQGFKLQGLDLIKPETGLSAFEQLITSELTQVGVMSADWQQLSQKFPFLRQSNYFAQLIDEPGMSKESEAQAENQILTELLATKPEKRPAYLTRYLQEAIAKILQISPEKLSINDSLLDIGMDSLMVMEAINQLKTDLQLILYPREFYEHPQISGLAEYLAVEFAKTHQKTVKKHSGANPKPKLEVLRDKLPPAAFILSSPRSGSTLLRVMLAGHPQLSSPPELHLLPFTTMSEREQELGISQLGEGLKRALMTLKGIDAEASQQLVASLIEEDLSIAEVYQMLQQLAGDRLLVDKSPTYASKRQTLERAEVMFNNAKYIHLVRHPYAVIESFARMRMDKLISSGNSDPYQLAELIWKDSNQNILDFAQQVSPERYHLVYYEDLVSKPQEIMTSICDFLEIPFDQAMLTPYQGDRMTDGVNNKAMSLGDPNFRNHQQINAQLGEAWREIELPSTLNSYTQQIARNLQYELPQEATAEVAELPMQETLLNIRGLRICLCTWGPEEGPIVLCLHGILEQGAAWSEVAIRLAQKGYRVIAPDLRGHGRSDRVDKSSSYNLIDFLGDIDAIVENLAGKAFILVGHSLGSVLGAIFATIRPQRIKNIVLVETILPTASEEEDPTTTLTNQLNYIAAPPEHPVFPDVEAAAERLRQATPAISKSLAMLLAERITEPCQGGVRWRWEPLLRTRAGISLNGIGRSRYLNLLKKITVPITLVYGDKSNFNRAEDLNKQQEAMPNATKVVVSGGHNLPLEAPSALAKIISGAVALTNKLIP
ncbi:type I polyketide synthase [Pleurocapsa sp. PCC 7319]|uniref:hybrid fatty acyl-AMP ligase/type I polyketide synthase n=1 Tax=Pleurocapsa sp. PCC 7319 TaxID=118161 RepID=UPI0005666066|nr:type I polyketide synthase [Pleurocapsa sp. PCC 7319]